MRKIAEMSWLEIIVITIGLFSQVLMAWALTSVFSRLPGVLADLLIAAIVIPTGIGIMFAVAAIIGLVARIGNKEH